MTHFKYVILGAGPSGLSFAHTLFKQGEESFVVLEKESEAGGLCRSVSVDGAPLDIGGGHFLDIRRRDTLDLLFQFMPEMSGTGIRAWPKSGCAGSKWTIRWRGISGN